MACPGYSSEDDMSDDNDYISFKTRIKNGPTLQLEPSQIIYNSLFKGNVEEIVQELNKGFDVNAPIQADWTTLTLAVSYGNIEITKELLKLGADPNLTKDTETPLMLACNVAVETRSEEIVEEIVLLLLAYKADPKTVNTRRVNAAMLAAENGQLKALKALMPFCNKEARDNQGWTLLFWAVSGNRLKVIEYLIEQECDCTVMDIRRNTLIDKAKFLGFDKVVEFFGFSEYDEVTDIALQHPPENFVSFNKFKRPEFFECIHSMLQGVRCENVLKEMSEHGVDLLEFLSMNEENLRQIGVELPFQRRRILGGLFRFHQQPFHRTSLLVVPKNVSYSNIDVATQLVTAIKQFTVMQASLEYIIRNLNTTENLTNDPELIRALAGVKHKLGLVEFATNKLLNRTRIWDKMACPVDLITSKSIPSKVPWIKLTLGSLMAGLVVIKLYVKCKN